MRRLIVLAFLALLATGAAASADVAEQVRVASAGGRLTQGLRPNVVLAFTSPRDYIRASFAGTEGRWLGPRYAATGDGNVGGDTSISWTLRFATGRDGPAIARAALVHDWTLDIRGAVSVRHLIGSRVVGTILGHYIVTRVPGARGAAHEAAMAFAVAPQVFAVLRFELPQPLTDDAGAAGTFLVRGLPASIWNRGQAFWVLTGVELRGPLPPTRVSALVAGGGRVVRGQVTDAFRHPVPRARVRLERSVGSAWRTVASTRSGPNGVYTLRGITTRGRYRSVATSGRAAVRSSAVVAGPESRTSS